MSDLARGPQKGDAEEHLQEVIKGAKRDPKRRLFVFAGIRFGSKGRYYQYRDITEHALQGSRLDPAGRQSRSFGLPFKKKLFKGRPGAMYSVEVEKDDDRLYVHGAGKKYAGQWPCEEEVTEWQVLHEAEKGHAARDYKRQRAVKRNLPMDVLEPFRRAYAKADRGQRSFILARIIEYVQEQ